jgi:bifunctional non-homologous end joining protein LigD
MHPSSTDEPFVREGWWFEPKWDGFRALAVRQGGRGRVMYRRGADAASTFPEIAAALEGLSVEHIVLDGELVVLEASGRANFHRLQRRALRRHSTEVRAAMARDPVSYYAFDILALEGLDLRPLPLSSRKEILKLALGKNHTLRYLDHLPTDGVVLYEHVRGLGLEGIVAKDSAAPYVAGRSRAWRRVIAYRTADLAIVGWTIPGHREAALHLAAFVNGSLRYRGSVHAGLDRELVGAFQARLASHAAAAPPYSGPGPRGPGHAWVQPLVVCEVRYREMTPDGHLRHPVFVRIRPDKPVTECTG